MADSSTHLLPRTAIPMPLETIAAFCEKWKVREFGLFGSVLRDDFREDSDVDVMVVFEPTAHPTFIDIAGMEEELEEVFNRPVDVLTRRGVESSVNWYRKRAILESVQVIYGR